MMSSYNAFLNIYTDKLRERVKDSPADYAFPVEQVPEVARKMVDAMARGSANIQSAAIRATCRAVGIKHTIGGIRNHLTAALAEKEA